MIDLDDTISITQLALGGAKKKYTLVDAFEFVQQGRNVGDAICYAERYGFWLMPGATNWKSN